MSVDFDRMAAHLPADQRKQLARAYRRGAKNETTAFLLAFFLGIFGVHHFYLGEWARGFAHLIIPVLAAIVLVAGVALSLPSLPVTIILVVLLAAGLLWEIVELFQVDNTVRKSNLELAESLIGAGALVDNSALTEAVAKLDSAVMAGAGLAGAAGVAAASGASGASGAITADDVSAARAMAGEHNSALMEEFTSSTTKYISDDPNATTPGAPNSWSETGPYQPLGASDAGEPAAGDTLDMPAPEYLTHTHTETEASVTDSYEFYRSPDATQPMPIPTTSEAEAKTWPDHPPLAETPIDPDDTLPRATDAGIPLAGIAAGAAALGAGALLAGNATGDATVAEGAGAEGTGAMPLAAAGPDVTDHHAFIPQAHPIADVEGAGARPHYVTLPDDQAAAGIQAGDVGIAPMAVDAMAHDATDAHPQAPGAEPVADVEGNSGQPVYVDLPGETYVPPIVPQMIAPETGAMAGLAGAGALGGLGAEAAYLASQDDAPPSTPESMPEAAPTSGPLMKRIRMKRQIVVDGQVVREEIVEKLVPADADTKSAVAEMDTQLGHASKEEIAHMANLDPDASLDVRQRFDSAPLSDKPAEEE